MPASSGLKISLSLTFIPHAGIAINRLNFRHSELSFRIQGEKIVVLGSMDKAAINLEIQHELYRAKIAAEGMELRSKLYKMVFSK